MKDRPVFDHSKTGAEIARERYDQPGAEVPEDEGTEKEPRKTGFREDPLWHPERPFTQSLAPAAQPYRRG